MARRGDWPRARGGAINKYTKFWFPYLLSSSSDHVFKAWGYFGRCTGGQWLVVKTKLYGCKRECRFSSKPAINAVGPHRLSPPWAPRSGSQRSGGRAGHSG